jgi:hypothetical protein
MHLLKGPVVVRRTDEPWNRRTVYDLTMTIGVGVNERASMRGMTEDALSFVKCQDPRRAESFPIYGGTGGNSD